jgi:hypothetical protein
MNCPNCNKKPVGLFYKFRLNEVGFKKSFKGYFKCKHCKTLLKETSRNDLSQYEKPYWYFLAGYFLIILASLLLVFYLLASSSISSLYGLLGYAGFLMALLALMNNYVKPRYWSIKVVHDAEVDEQTSRRLTSKGWAIFLIYSIIAVSLFIAIPVFFESTHLSELYILLGTILYSMAVIGGAIYILFQFSTQRSKNS